ncbi:MAG: hypothetical protein AAGF92_24595, partial [Myxococcota bacterium]
MLSDCSWLLVVLRERIMFDEGNLFPVHPDGVAVMVEEGLPKPGPRPWLWFERVGAIFETCDLP